MTDVWLDVAGSRYADTAADLESGTPTVLADLELAWGRATTVDQPDASTLRFQLLDRSGGTSFVDTVPIGVPVDLWTSGEVSGDVDAFVDGSFETLPVGPAGDRVAIRDATSTATITAADAADGVQSLALTDPTFRKWSVVIPPAAYDHSDLTAWDSIPKLVPGAVWQWAIRVRPGPGMDVRAYPVGIFQPDSGYYDAVTIGSVQTVTGDGVTWYQLGGTAQVGSDEWWVGIDVYAFTLRIWTSAPGTWAQQVGTWAAHVTAYADAAEVIPPASGVMREVLVFSGRVTDLAAAIDRDGTARVDAVAVDQLADLQNRYVGDQPWAAETLATRVQRIVNLSGASVQALVDQPLQSLQVSRRDVDNQPAGGLLAELAAGVDGVLWSATHGVDGPFLWIEDVRRRATVAVLAMVDGQVEIVPDPETNAAEGRTALDGSVLPQGQVTWTRDITDVITRVDASWIEQTTPDLTDRTVRVVDAEAEAGGTVIRMGVATPLISAQDATDVANRILTRTRKAAWRTEGLAWDCGLIPPDGEQMSNLLDLLDGTRRIGRGIVVTNVERWPGGSAAAYLDGGRYQYRGAWRLELITTPSAGIVQSGPWNSLDPTWRWNQFDPAIGWADMYGVTGPN